MQNFLYGKEKRRRAVRVCTKLNYRKGNRRVARSPGRQPGKYDQRRVAVAKASKASKQSTGITSLAQSIYPGYCLSS